MTTLLPTKMLLYLALILKGTYLWAPYPSLQVLQPMSQQWRTIFPMNELGTLKKVPLREEWVHEAHAFTKWLADESSISRLSDELGVDITLIETESNIGSFNVDILAKETTSDRMIVIENQLERTDHDHLGKIITYASGVDAAFVVWIVAAEREEHKRAIDWLNEHTGEEISFFLVRIELWQIGDSLRAPKFVVVSKPNGWAKATRQNTIAGSKNSETKLMQLEFWEAFREWGINQETSLKLRTPRPQHWYDIAGGSSRWHLALTINTTTQQIACEVYIPADKELYAQFEENRAAIESIVGEPLEWMELPEKKASRIKISRSANLEDESDQIPYFEWMLTRAERFKKAFNSIKQN